MRCPSCGHQNREGRKFCSECAAALEVRCQSCQSLNEPGEKFCGECAAPLEGGTQAAVAATGPEREPSPQPTLDHPASFADGRYQVQKFLGEGGKKIVYLANDTLLDRDVAFALIKTEGLDEAGRTRITREAQAMGRLGSHPHIVTVFDLGDHQGQPYMVSELMGGGDVEGIIDSAPGHRVPLDRVVAVAVETCRGLEFAHAKGIVHRDLKPGNVWLTDGPSTGSGRAVAKIGDFGLAVATDRSRLTQEGMMVGTVSYMPPEQAMGGEVTGKADLYSLGAMLYEMVTGRPPFLGDDSVAIIGQHINTPPVAPTWHNPGCPPALEALVLRLLEKDPDSRPASAGEVLQALEAIDLEAGPEPSMQEPQTQTPVYRRTFVGREAELRRLHTAFDSAMSGEGSLVMVVGEPGIGKTSLCEQLATYVTLRRGVALVGHCYEEGSLSLPYLGFVEAIRSYVIERDADNLEKELGSGAAEVARIVSEIRERVDVEPSAPTDPEEDRYRLLQTVSTFLRNASGVQPLLIVLEDLHDADRGTLDMLSHLARNLSGSRLLIVGTYRDVEVDRAHALSGALAELRRSSAFGRIALRGLTADEVQRMINGIAQQEAPWGLAEAVHRQTEGNPLFIQEVLRYLVEEGLVAREDGSWRATGQTPLEMGIPEGLRDVIGKRLTRLSDECNRVLAVAAVVGRDFRLDVLQDVSGVSEEELYAALEEAGGAAMIEERSAVGAGVSFRFAHAFFRQTLYEETFAPRRIRLHQQVGRSLEEIHSSRLEEHASELAEHFAQSTELEDLWKALSYGEMAVQRAMSVYAYSEAAGHLDRCLQVHEVLSPDDKAKRCDLLLALGEALLPSGEPLRVAEGIAPEAFVLAETLGDNSRASAVAIQAIWGFFRYGAGLVLGGPEWRMWVERADRLATPETLERVFADAALALVQLFHRKDREGRAIADRALKLARELDEPEALWFAALGKLTPSRWRPRDIEEGIQLAQEVAGWPRAGAGYGLALTLHYCALACIMSGKRDQAEALWDEIEDLAVRTRDSVPRLLSLNSTNLLLLLDGRVEESLQGAERFTDRAEELGSPLLGQLFFAQVSLRPLLYLGRAEEALTSTVQLGGPWSAVHPLCLAHVGRRDEAQEALDGLVRQQDLEPEVDETPWGPLSLMLEVAVSLGDQDTVAALAPRLADLDKYAPLPYQSASLGRNLGAEKALLGDRERARVHYQAGLEVLAKIRHRPEIALTRLQLAELLLEHYPDERSEALEHLDFAIGEFRDMKMQPSLERALSHRDILKA